MKTKNLIKLGVVAALSVAMLPLTSYADSGTNVDGTVWADSNPGNAIVQLEVMPVISLTLEGNTDATSSKLSLAPNQKDEATLTTTAKVSTNSLNGYTLAVKPATGSPVDLTNDNGDKILASTNISAGSNSWALKGGDLSGYTAMTTAGFTVKTNNNSEKQAINEDETVITYGVSTAAAQPTGIYTTTLVYTATTQN